MEGGEDSSDNRNKGDGIVRLSLQFGITFIKTFFLLVAHLYTKQVHFFQAYRIISCRPSLIEERAQLLIRGNEFYGEPVKYGITMEPRARRAFEKEHGTTVTQFGLVVCEEDPWLACSPDGIFRYLFL